MKKTLIYIAVLFISVHTSGAQMAGEAGAFARMGFGARGIGMGNALTAVQTGTVSTYYNPALAAFAEQRAASASFGILSFDRYLNFLSYTQHLKPHAGISAGVINAGVRNIDGRDSDGKHTTNYSTTENQFYLSFSNRFFENISLGVTIKLYYAKLFEDFTSTTVGFDVGFLVRLSDKLSLGGCMQDLNSKYKWDSKPLYDEKGRTIENKFPNLRRIALAYKVFDGAGVIDVEFENSSVRTNSIRMGAEYNIVEYFTLRGGIDRWELGDKATGQKPTFGFSAKNSFNGWIPELTYAFVFEPVALHGMHLITLSIVF